MSGHGNIAVVAVIIFMNIHVYIKLVLDCVLKKKKENLNLHIKYFL